MVDVLRGEDRDAFGRGQLGHGMEPQVLLGIVHMGEDGRDLDVVPE